MLTIRTEQLATFAAAHRAEFVDRLLPHLAASFPPWFAQRQEQGAKALVERAIEIGEQSGIRGEWAVMTLVELIIEFGENFEMSPDHDWAVKLLAHRSLPDRLKVAMLSERLRQRSGGRRIVEVDSGLTG